METKICTKCGGKKELSEFYKSKTHRNGRSSQCKICRNAYYKKYSQSKNNKLKHSESSLRYYYQNKDECIVRNKKYRKSNKEKIKEYHKEYSIKIRETKKNKNYYISNILVNQGLKRCSITSDLVECKLMMLKIKRLIKNK